jgi:AcrR family transcriptional regulator
VLDSVLEVIETEGLGGLSMDEVAHRAGVSKATIYRRWQSKEDLLIDVMARLSESVAAPDTGSIRGDLITVVSGVTTFMRSGSAGSIFPWLVGEMAAQTDIGRKYAETVIIPRRHALAEVIRRAVERGELHDDLDVELAVDMLTGPVILRKLMGFFRPVGDDWAEALVDRLLEGWRPGV